MRVVEQLGKLHLCMNPMYLNVFVRYARLKYKTLMTDMQYYVRPEDWLYATDDKSGYWQMAMHPSAFRFIPGLSVGRAALPLAPSTYIHAVRDRARVPDLRTRL